jgi:Putative DNA-binding domain
MNREALRQQLLVRALWRDDAALQGWVRVPVRATARQALAAYRGNASALAERALGSAYPTIAALVGDASFAALARHFWQRHPPERGDIALWGAALPAFIADSAQLADEPYLADSARLDWAVHLATRADDGGEAAIELAALADADPTLLHLRLVPSTALVSSRFPVVAIWQAHHAALPMDQVRAAFDAGRADHAFVHRDRRYRVQVEALSDADAAFTQALIAGHSLAAALDQAGAAFAFDHWLARALGAGWLMGLSTPDTADTADTP